MERFESVVARHGPPTLTVFSELTRVVLSCEFANRVILRMVLVEMHEFDGVHQTLQTLPNPRIGFHIFQDVTEFLLPKDVEMIVVRRRVCDIVVGRVVDCIVICRVVIVGRIVIYLYRLCFDIFVFYHLTFVTRFFVSGMNRLCFETLPTERTRVFGDSFAYMFVSIK